MPRFLTHLPNRLRILLQLMQHPHPQEMNLTLSYSLVSILGPRKPTILHSRIKSANICSFSGVAWAWSGASNDIKVVTDWEAYEYLNSDKDKAPTEMLYNNLMSNNQGSPQTTPDANWGYGIPTGSQPLKWFKLLLLDDEDMDENIRNSGQITRARELLKATKKTAVDVIADYLHFLWKHTLKNIQQDMGIEAVD